MIRIAIVDDHSIVRTGLRQYFSEHVDLRVTGEAANGREALDLVRRGDLDVLVMDLSMPGPGGLELIRQVLGHVPQLPVLVLSMHADGPIVTRMLRAGAVGYLTKDCDPEELLTAVRNAARGRRYIDPSLVDSVIRSHAAAEQATDHCAELSERERQVLERMVAGRSVGAIADELQLSPKTVSTHKTRLMHKLEVHSIADLMRFAIRHGITER